jgi:hypothetical protein
VLCTFLLLLLFHGSTAPSALSPRQCWGFEITFRHNTLYDSSGLVISSMQTPLPDNTRHSQQTDIHVPGGIRTHNPSKRAAADPRFRLHDHQDRLVPLLTKVRISYSHTDLVHREPNGSGYWSWTSGYYSGRLQEFDLHRTSLYGYNIIQYH